jgi:hypothetical protein
MRTARLVSLFVITALVFAGCTATKMSKTESVYETPIAVEANYDEDLDWSKFSTWTWVPSIGATGDATLDDPEFRDVVGTAVQKELFAKGYERNDQSPDLVLNAMVAIEKIDKAYIEENFQGTYKPDYYADLPDGGAGKKSWDEGTLMIFIYDAAKGQVVWHGTAKTEVYKKAVDGMWQKRVGEIVAQLLESVPPRGK